MLRSRRVAPVSTPTPPFPLNLRKVRELCVLLGVRDLILDVRSLDGAGTKEGEEEVATGVATDERRIQTEAKEERVAEERERDVGKCRRNKKQTVPQLLWKP